MDELEMRLARIIHDTNVTYKTNISFELAKNQLGYGSRFLSVTNRNNFYAISSNAGMYYELKEMSDEQITSKILAVLGLLDAVPVNQTTKEKEKMSAYDSQDVTKLKEEAGRNAAETILPFIRTDVPFTNVHKFAALVAQWSGYGDSSAFTTGFMSVFFEYRDSQGLIESGSKRLTQQEEM